MIARGPRIHRETSGESRTRRTARQNNSRGRLRRTYLGLRDNRTPRSQKRAAPRPTTTATRTRAFVTFAGRSSPRSTAARGARRRRSSRRLRRGARRRVAVMMFDRERAWNSSRDVGWISHEKDRAKIIRAVVLDELFSVSGRTVHRAHRSAQLRVPLHLALERERLGPSPAARVLARRPRGGGSAAAIESPTSSRRPPPRRGRGL